MSMIGNYLRVSPESLDELSGNPEEILDVLSAEGSAGRSSGRHLDIDKTWHAIHFLLNGKPWDGKRPLYNAVLGGMPIGEEDVGYGPARGLDPDEVRAVAEALGALPANQLLERFDPAAMNKAEIYPEGWTEDPEHREYISDYYTELVAFFEQAARAGDAMLLYIN